METTSEHPHITLARNLFAAWSSGNADAPAPYLHPDAVLYDTVGGRHHGWSTIRKFFDDGNAIWSDLNFDVGAYWVSDSGVALRWVMSATVPDDRFGPDAKGKKWTVDGMTELTIVDAKVSYEADHWNGAQIMNSLGLPARK